MSRFEPEHSGLNIKLCIAIKLLEAHALLELHTDDSSGTGSKLVDVIRETKIDPDLRALDTT